jgi:hypothetical protein
MPSGLSSFTCVAKIRNFTHITLLMTYLVKLGAAKLLNDPGVRQ